MMAMLMHERRNQADGGGRADFQQALDAPASDRGDDPELGKVGADRVDDSRLLADQ
jgi:hypothetical protein